MADDEIVIKIRVDDNDLKKIKSKGQQEILPDSTKSVLPKGTKGAGASKSAMGGFGIGQATQGLGMAKGGVMNPIGMIQQTILPMLTKFLPKMLLKAIPVVGWAVLAIELVPIIIKQVVKILTSVGGPFNKRFRRIIKNEVNGFFTREEQQRRRLGLDPVIMTTVVGFSNNGGLQTVNTLNKVGDTGISGIGLEMKAQGVQP